MRLSCPPRSTPIIVRSHLSQCQARVRRPSAPFQHPSLPSMHASFSFPLRRRMSTQPASGPAQEHPRNSRTEFAEKPPAADAPSAQSSAEMQEEEEDRKREQQQMDEDAARMEALATIPIEEPDEDPMKIWDHSASLNDDPNRWWKYEPLLPPVAKSFMPFEVLLSHHRRMLRLVHLIRHETDARTKEVLLWRLHKEVIYRDIIERRVLFPVYKAVLHRVDPSNTSNTRLKKQHRAARRAFRKIKTHRKPTDPLLASAINTAIHHLKVHYYEEETQLFPFLESQLPLGVQYWMRVQMFIWAFFIRVFGPFAARAKRPPWDQLHNRLYSLWRWRWGR